MQFLVDPIYVSDMLYDAEHALVIMVGMGQS